MGEQVHVLRHHRLRVSHLTRDATRALGWFPRRSESSPRSHVSEHTCVGGQGASVASSFGHRVDERDPAERHGRIYSWAHILILILMNAAK